MDFDSLQEDAPAKATGQAPPSVNGMTPDFDSLPDDQQKYGTLGQQILTGIEGGAQGFAGPFATAAEEGLSRLGVPGISAPERVGRAETNPWTHGITEGLGFIGGLGTGASEAGVLGNVGEHVAQGVTQAITGGVAKSALESVGARLAAGAARTGAEMAIYQAGDEASKAINNIQGSVGDAAANVGLSSLLGGVFGGVGSAIGMAGKAAINSQVLNDFGDRLAFRGANVNPNEMMQHELSTGINSFDQIGDEVNGYGGLKSEAISKLLPQEMTQGITGQVQDTANLAQEALGTMMKGDVPPRLAKDFQGVTNKYLEAVTNPEATVGDHFDALNQFKNDLQDYSKGRYGLLAPQRTAEDYNFLNITKGLASTVKTGLEDSGVWSGAADVQKQINKAWSESIPAVKDVTKKFMTRVGNEYQVDPQKFMTYMNQNGKATSTTIRQQMMGNFVDAMQGFHDAVAKVSERAGIENPIDPN